MSARVVAALAMVTVALSGQANGRATAQSIESGGGICCAGGDVNRPEPSVTSWVAHEEVGGGVRPPTPVSVCSAWSHAADVTPDLVPEDIESVWIDDDGGVWNLFVRVCDGQNQFVWVPELDPEQVAELAFDQVTERLPVPGPTVSPDVSVGGYVNFETWLAVEDPGPVSATASIPGLAATATARVVRIEWDPGDGTDVVVCEPFGALPPSPGFTGPAPCGHTYSLPSHPAVTGSDDQVFHGSVTLVWEASWAATDGSSGALGEARSTSPFAYAVREIQTIGVEG